MQPFIQDDQAMTKGGDAVKASQEFLDKDIVHHKIHTPKPEQQSVPARPNPCSSCNGCACP